MIAVLFIVGFVLGFILGLFVLTYIERRAVGRMFGWW